MTKKLLGKIKEIEGKLGQDWMQKLEGITTAEALIKKASEYDIVLTEEMASEALNLISNEDAELSEEELAAIAGGPKAF